MSILYDVHCHLDAPQFDADREEVIERARIAGVRYIICNGTTSASNRAILALAQKHDIILAALGFYPTDALKMDVDAEIDFIRSQRDHIVAIGEVGIDYHWVTDKEERVREVEIFRKAILLAQELKKPLIVHSRKAEDVVLDMLAETKFTRVDLHCFGGNAAQIKRALDLGLSFSIPANVVRSDHFQRLVGMAPMSRLFFETDAPYLGPDKDKRSEPADVALAAKKIAQIKGLEEQEVRNLLFMNFQKMFL